MERRSDRVIEPADSGAVWVQQRAIQVELRQAVEKANRAARVGRSLGVCRMELQRGAGSSRGEETVASQKRELPMRISSGFETEGSPVDARARRSVEPTPTEGRPRPVLNADLARAVAKAGIEPTTEGQALQDALLPAIAGRRGDCT